MSICIHRCDRTPHPSCQSHVGQHKSKSFAASFTPALRSRSVNYSGDYSLIIQRWSLPVVALLICSLWRHVMDDVSFTNFIDIPPPPINFFWIHFRASYGNVWRLSNWRQSNLFGPFFGDGDRPVLSSEPLKQPKSWKQWNGKRLSMPFVQWSCKGKQLVESMSVQLRCVRVET